MRSTRKASRIPAWFNAGVLFMSVVLHLAAAVLILFEFRGTGAAGEEWSGDALVLVLFSAVLSVGIRFMSWRIGAVLFMFVVRIGIIVMVGYPMENGALVLIALSASLGMDTGLFASVKEAVVLTILLVLGIFCFYRGPRLVWGTELPAMTLYARGFPPLASLFSAFLGGTCRWSFHQMHFLKKDTEDFIQTIAQLSDANVKYQQYAVHVESEAALRERNRITREIHDTMGHAIATSMMIMEAASIAAGVSVDKTRSILKEGRLHLKDCRTEIHNSLLELRAYIDPTSRGLLGIAKLVRSFEAVTLIKIRVEYANMPLSMGPRIDMILFRFIQEGMTNAFLHGRATEIRIVFWRDSKGVIVTISDNGKGAKKLQQGIGMLGMQERVAGVNGHLWWRSGETGFEISMDIPVEAKDGQENASVAC